MAATDIRTFDIKGNTLFIVREPGINYTAKIPSNILTTTSREAVRSALEDAQLNGLPDSGAWAGKGEGYQKLAESVAYSAYHSGQQRLLDNNVDPAILKYGPTSDYEAQEAYNTESARILGEPIYNELSYSITGPVAEINKASYIEPSNGITINPREQVVDGQMVNPYKSLQKFRDPTQLYDTIGGSDLTVFLLMETTKIEDFGKPKEVQRKEVIMIEMEGALSLSYSILREKFPIRQLGNPLPIAYTKGIRTIAGHMAFAVFTEDTLSRLRSRLDKEIEAVTSEFDKYVAVSDKGIASAKEKYAEWLEKKYYYELFSGNKQVQLLDDLPMFHILVMGMNETGQFSKMLIRNVTITDENQYQGTEQPNIINKVSWIATDIVPMHSLKNEKTVAISSINSMTESFSNGIYSGGLTFNTEITGSSLLGSIEKDLYGGK